MNDRYEGVQHVPPTICVHQSTKKTACRHFQTVEPSAHTVVCLERDIRKMPSIAAVLILSACIVWTCGYPSGAPASVCHKDPQKRVRRPHHGNATAQPNDYLPYTILADTDRYAPGGTIRLAIGGSETFRGFFVQALDRQTGQPVGGFLSAANTTLLADCATITHADPADKQYAFLVWHAPAEQSGRVDFR